MADQSVKIQDDSHYRVALDLAMQIAFSEANMEKAPIQDRAYWLDLYHRCQLVVFSRQTGSEALKAK